MTRETDLCVTLVLDYKQAQWNMRKANIKV